MSPEIGQDVFMSDASLIYLNEKRRRLEQKARMAQLAVPVFRGDNLAAQTETQHEWVLAGPADTGKTWATIWRLDKLMRETPRARGALVRKTRAHMTATVLHTFRAIQERHSKPAVASGGDHPEWYDYPNGARLYVIGLDKSGKVLSGEFDFIYVNQAEELLLEDWETLSSRCSGRGAVTKTPMIFADCNPGPPTHWLLHRDGCKMLHSKHEDNPTLHDGNDWTADGLCRLAILDSLTGVRRERLRFGRWVAAEGVVYEEFDRGIHVVDTFDIPSDWRRVRSIDFGFTNPFVCQWWAIDPDGRMYLYREIYHTQRLVSDHAIDILRLSEGEHIEATIGDHDAEGRATLEAAGIIVDKADKAKKIGIERVASRLRLAGDGFPRLFLLEDTVHKVDESLAQSKRPTCFLDELEVYIWQKSPDGRPIKEEPLDVNNHSCDAARYAVAYLDADAGGGGWAAYGAELKANRGLL